MKRFFAIGISFIDTTLVQKQIRKNCLRRYFADARVIFLINNTARCFEGEPAYDLYVKLVCGGVDPQQEDSLTDRMHRLANGTDETSITYL